MSFLHLRELPFVCFEVLALVLPSFECTCASQKHVCILPTCNVFLWPFRDVSLIFSQIVWLFLIDLESWGKPLQSSSIFSGSILYSFIDTIIDSSLERKKKSSVVFMVFTSFFLTVTTSSEHQHLQIFLILEYSLRNLGFQPFLKISLFPGQSTFFSNPLTVYF